MLIEKRIKRAIKNKVKVTMAQEDLVRLTLQFLILKAQTHQAPAIDKRNESTSLMMTIVPFMVQSINGGNTTKINKVKTSSLDVNTQAHPITLILLPLHPDPQGSMLIDLEYRFLPRCTSIIISSSIAIILTPEVT